MIIIHANLNVLPEKREVFLGLTKELVKASQAEEGNQRYTLMQDVNDPNKFTVVEEWKDQAAVDFHNQTAHFQSFVAAVPECLAEPLQASIFANADQVK
jgi:quinol monooxygenase YgiN